MRANNRYVRTFFSVVLLIIFGVVQAEEKAGGADEVNPPLRSIMSDVLDSTAYLMSLSFYSSIWDSYQGDEQVQEKLDLLVKSAKAMDEHADLVELERRYLSRSFTDTVALAKDAFEADAGAWAWYAMLDLTEHCAACHTQAPGRPNLSIGDSLVENMDMQAIERYHAAQIFVAVRQFDKAMSMLEAELLDPAVKPTQTELSGVYYEYLNIIVSSDGDYARADKTLSDVLLRDDVPYYLRRRVEVWRMSLKTLSDDPNRGVTPVAARALYDRATELNAIPGMGDGAVLDLAAANIYRKYIAATPDIPKDQLAKAYFGLALIEMRNTQVRIAVPEMELLLQAAIQADPSGALAKPAYSLLEEFGVNAASEGPNPLTERPSLIDLSALRKMIGLKDSGKSG